MNTFAKQLIKKGIRATVRRSRGDDIMAACGQLKSQTDVLLRNVARSATSQEQG